MSDTTRFSRLLQRSEAAIRSLSALEAPAAQAAAVMAASLAAGGRILTCGNGGSAAESGHLATELLCRLHRDRRSLPAVNLCADGSFLTAMGNDYSFDEIFARQVTGLAKSGDVLVTFSTSGKSRNICRALAAAREAGVTSIALLGRDGGEARALADHALVVPVPDTMHIQEAHQVLLHILCVEIEAILFPGLNPEM